ncbi:complex I intermediate-associated protein 30-domain-containing protein [Xylariales sp. PMI_506]|nr:complex I intermediate-associated protein 30-domain-containing protein [Xylariales sp. PMI_506]
MAMDGASLDLFGGSKAWSEHDWVASDDRVRGGRSQSYLACTPSSRAVFHGTLDITALGGAGFASQRTADPRLWDLSSYGGLSLKVVVGEGDGKTYTLVVKDEVLPKRADGREQSTVSWEFDFACQNSELFVPWAAFKPTYRGKPCPDAKRLDTTGIRRISIMMRSFFGEQEGPFRLEIERIAALMTGKAPIVAPRTPPDGKTAPRSWVDGIFGLFGKG